MKNSNEFDESEQMPQAQPNEFQPPPPYYTVENTNINAQHPNWTTNIPNIPNDSTLNIFNQTLGSNERLTISPTGRLGCMNRTIIVQIRDANQHPILSVMTTAGRNVSTRNDNSARIGSVIQMTNSAGQTLLTANESVQSFTVTSGEQVLGLVDANLLCSSTLTARSNMGEFLFQSVGGTEINANTSGGCCNSVPSEFSLISNGVELAHIEKSTNNCTISLFNSQNLDARMKALLIFTSYLIYYTFMAETPFGEIGVRGMAKKLCMFMCIFFVLVTILFISIPIIVTQMN